MSTTGHSLWDEPARCSVLQLIDTVLIRQKRGSPLLWKNYLQENNKAGSLFLAFSSTGRRACDGANNIGVGSDGDDESIIDIHTNKTRSKGFWDSSMICPYTVFSLFKNIHLFIIYLAVSGLGCGTRDVHCLTRGLSLRYLDSLVMVHEGS